MEKHGTRNEKLHSKLTKGIVFASRVALALVVVFLLGNGLTDYEESRFLFATQPKWVLAALVVCTEVFLHAFLEVLLRLFQKLPDRGNRWLRGIMVLAAVGLQAIFLFYYRSSYLFDSAFVTGGASALAESGAVAKEAVYYLSAYPNQNAYAVLTAILWKVGKLFGMSRGQIPLLLNFVNLLCLDSAVGLFFAIVKECKPRLSSAKWTLLYVFMFLNPFLYIGVSYYYTITISMPFVMLLLYLYVKYLRKEDYKGIKIPVLAGVVLGIGYLMRATTIIPAIAIGCVILFYGKKRKKDLLILLTAIACIMGIGKMNSAYVGLDTKDTAFPTTHWVMMSMTSPGAHNGEDEAYTASFATSQEKKAAVAARMKEKAQQMDAGDWASLALAKIKNTWGNGSNGYTVYLEHCLGSDGLFKWVFGNHNDFLILYHQGYYLLLLVWILYDIIASIIRKREDSYVFQLTFLGAVLFYLLWETSAQYSLPFLFVLMLSAVFGMDEKWNREQKESTAATAKVLSYAQTTLRILCLVFLCLFFIKKYPVFTQMQVDENNPVVTQILANEELELEDGQKLSQTFRAFHPFNQIIFQWRNPDAASNAEYLVKVQGEDGADICSETIRAEGQPYNGASVLSFQSVTPKRGEEFVLCIEKIKGDEQYNLRFVTYKMGFYDAYPYGKLCVDGNEQTRDMLLAVSEVRAAPYCSRGFYWMSAALILLFGATVCLLGKKKGKKQ